MSDFSLHPRVQTCNSPIALHGVITAKAGKEGQLTNILQQWYHMVTTVRPSFFLSRHLRCQLTLCFSEEGVLHIGITTTQQVGVFYLYELYRSPKVFEDHKTSTAFQFFMQAVPDVVES